MLLLVFVWLSRTMFGYEDFTGQANLPSLKGGMDLLSVGLLQVSYTAVAGTYQCLSGSGSIAVMSRDHVSGRFVILGGCN